MDTLYVMGDSVECDVLSFKEANCIVGIRDSTRNTLSGCGIQIAPLFSGEICNFRAQGKNGTRFSDSNGYWRNAWQGFTILAVGQRS
jgi:hypothetical protein